MQPKSKQTVLALANTIELGTAALQELVGHEVANTLGGQKITTEALSQLMASRLLTHFTKFTNKPVVAK